jgi:hypothetical protein
LKQKTKTLTCYLKNISLEAFWCIENLNVHFENLSNEDFEYFLEP